MQVGYSTHCQPTGRTASTVNNVKQKLQAAIESRQAGIYRFLINNGAKVDAGDTCDAEAYLISFGRSYLDDSVDSCDDVL